VIFSVLSLVENLSGECILIKICKTISKCNNLIKRVTLTKLYYKKYTGMYLFTLFITRYYFFKLNIICVRR